MEKRIKQPSEPTVYLDVRPKPGVAADTLRKRVASIETLLRRVHQNHDYSVVERIEPGPAGRTPRLRLILSHNTTGRDVYMVTGGIRSYLTADSALRRGVLAAVGLKEANA